MEVTKSPDAKMSGCWCQVPLKFVPGIFTEIMGYMLDNTCFNKNKWKRMEGRVTGIHGKEEYDESLVPLL